MGLMMSQTEVLIYFYYRLMATKEGNGNIDDKCNMTVQHFQIRQVESKEHSRGTRSLDLCRYNTFYNDMFAHKFTRVL